MARILCLNLSGLRNLAPLSQRIAADMIVISGENGSGKTAILEGIHLLATGRSFREHRVQRCQQWQMSEMTLFVEVQQPSGVSQLGWQKRGQETYLRRDGESVSSQAALAQCLPVQVFAPDHQTAWMQGPAERRRFIDWGAFYAYPDFLLHWRQYQHALKQRNHALKQGLPNREIALWHPPLWQAAHQLDHIRQTYLARLQPLVTDYIPKLSHALDSLTLHYASGWAADTALLTHWETHIDQDRQMGFTQAGPHRADLKLKVDGRDALAVLSRGQKKLLALLLMLVQTHDMTLQLGQTPVLLFDDLAAELDASHRAAVLQLLPDLGCQTFLTTTDVTAFSHLEAEHWRIKAGSLLPY